MNQKKCDIGLAALVLLTFIASAYVSQDLETSIRKRISGFEGEVGVYVHHLKTGDTIAINADETFPTASLIKIPILVTLFDAIEAKKLDYDADLTWRADVVHYPPGGILSSFQEDQQIKLSQIVSLMITHSDNHASLWCQSLCGGGAEINAFMEENGFQKTRVNSRTPGREKQKAEYGWGQTTPKEMAEMLVRLRQNEWVSPAASEEMYRLLCSIYWNGEALSQIPPHIQAASKQGAVDASRSEAVLVNAPSGDYVFCVITKNQTDTSWDAGNAGFVLLRDVSRMIWNHFEPGYPWQPAAGSERYR